MCNDFGMEQRLAQVEERLCAACDRVGRKREDILLIAVSKRQTVEAIRHAYALGVRDFGENYVQELQTKSAELSSLQDLRWHMIGHLQRNKVRDVVRVGARIATVDSSRLVDAIQTKAATAGIRVSVQLQVNLAEEPQKAGCGLSDLPNLVDQVRRSESIDLGGLMTVPPADATEKELRSYFQSLRRAAERFSLPEVSMGMSADFEIAVEEGATQVRIGSKLFGPRN